MRGRDAVKLIRPGEPLSDLEEWVRPGGTYRRRSGDLLSGSVPFEIERVSLPPGATNWPYHAHAAMWEVYVVERGRGSVRSPDGTTAVEAGDWFVHPPGEPHNLTNTGAEDLIYVVIANNVPNGTTIHDG